MIGTWIFDGPQTGNINPKYAIFPLLIFIIACCEPAFCQAKPFFIASREAASNYVERGETYLDRKQYSQAINAYTKAIELDPTYVLAFFHRGDAYLLMGQYDQAIKDYTRAIELDPRWHLSFDGRGTAYSRMGQYDQAIKDYTRAIELDPRWHLPFDGRGDAYLEMRQYDQAIRDFTRAIELNPTYVLAFFHRGKVYRTMGNYDQAVKDYTRAIELNPGFDLAFSSRGGTYLEMGQYDQAVKDFTRALELDPTFGLAFDLRGEVYLKMGQYDQAIKDFTRAIELDPDSSWTLAYRGEAYLNKGQFDLAVRDLKKAVELNPRNEWARSRLTLAQKQASTIPAKPLVTKGWLYVNPQPSDARVRILNIRPRYRDGIALDPGKYHIEVSKKGYEMVRQWVSLKGGKKKEVDISLKPVESIISGPHPSQRWAVVIGISSYKDSRISSLRYAAADARAFHNWLVSPKGGRYAPANVRVLVDEDATYKNIRKALFVWLKQAIAEDVVTIYFAGHGSPESPDAPKNLFLLPFDTKYDDISITGFPMWDIETALKRYIKAKRVIVIADACHSAGVGQGFDLALRATRAIKVNPITSTLQDLSHIGEGICVLTASDYEQYSKEDQKWGGGHGVFTHFLLQGLKGKADYNEDGMVTLGEIIPYLSENVRRETQSSQSPTVAGKFDPGLTIEK